MVYLAIWFSSQGCGNSFILVITGPAAPSGARSSAGTVSITKWIMFSFSSFFSYLWFCMISLDQIYDIRQADELSRNLAAQYWLQSESCFHQSFSDYLWLCMISLDQIYDIKQADELSRNLAAQYWLQSESCFHQSFSDYLWLCMISLDQIYDIRRADELSRNLAAQHWLQSESCFHHSFCGYLWLCMISLDQIYDIRQADELSRNLAAQYWLQSESCFHQIFVILLDFIRPDGIRQKSWSVVPKFGSIVGVHVFSICLMFLSVALTDKHLCHPR